MTQVESDVVVPVEFASDKQEYAARTLRPRIQEYLDDFLVGLTRMKISQESLNMKAEGIDHSDIEKVLDGMDLDRSVGALSHLYRGGTSEAKKVFRRFLKDSFGHYVGHRNQPQTDDVSHMSKYRAPGGGSLDTHGRFLLFLPAHHRSEARAQDFHRQISRIHPDPRNTPARAGGSSGRLRIQCDS